jgi:hypothetical protein
MMTATIPKDHSINFYRSSCPIWRWNNFRKLAMATISIFAHNALLLSGDRKVNEPVKIKNCL